MAHESNPVSDSSPDVTRFIGTSGADRIIRRKQSQIILARPALCSFELNVNSDTAPNSEDPLKRAARRRSSFAILSKRGGGVESAQKEIAAQFPAKIELSIMKGDRLMVVKGDCGRHLGGERTDLDPTFIHLSFYDEVRSEVVKVETQEHWETIFDAWWTKSEDRVSFEQRRQFVTAMAKLGDLPGVEGCVLGTHGGGRPDAGGGSPIRVKCKSRQSSGFSNVIAEQIEALSTLWVLSGGCGCHIILDATMTCMSASFCKA